ncbi:MAG: hypothetical protein ACI9Y7_002771 [Dokdonia sp.]|jgi:hypothetical protein
MTKSLIIQQRILVLSFFMILMSSVTVKAQTETQQVNRIGGHFGVVQPIVTLQSGEVNDAFNPYTLGFPIGITVRKSDRFAFDAEFVPFISFNAAGENDNVSLLVHPGFLWKVGDQLTYGTRLAYEIGDAGRYGFTPILNRGFSIGNQPFFIEFVLPVRFGSDQDVSVTAALHFGIGF